MIARRARGVPIAVVALAATCGAGCQLVVGTNDRFVGDAGLPDGGSALEDAAPMPDSDQPALDAAADGRAAHDAGGDAQGSQPGDLDVSFGSGGAVTTSVGTDGEAEAAIATHDGGVLVAGRAVVSGVQRAIVARYDATGKLDATFGMGGVVTLTAGTGESIAYAIAASGDGCVVAGSVVDAMLDPAAVPHMFVARLGADGSLDAAFGDGGVAELVLVKGAEEEARGVALLEDGRVALAGTSTKSPKSQLAIARVTASGAPDAALGAPGGKVLPILGGPSDVADVTRTFALTDPARGIAVLAGSAQVGSGGAGLVARVLGNAQLDTSFAAKGWTSLDPTTSADVAEGTAVTSGGGVALGGVAGAGASNPNFLLTLVTRGGAVDNTFGETSPGYTITDLGGADDAHALAIDERGRLLLAGESSEGATSRMAVARYDAAGHADTAFGRGAGWSVLTIAADGATGATARALATTDRGIVLAGSATVGGARRIALARVLP